MKPLTGHTSPTRGFRFVSQTENPKVSPPRWNKPKPSTYVRLGAAMFLNDEGHVDWAVLTEYSDAPAVLAFLDTFPDADVSALAPWAAAKVAYLARIQRDTPTVDDRAAELSAWRTVASRVPLSRAVLPLPQLRQPVLRRR
jgi:hypothetical protein